LLALQFDKVDEELGMMGEVGVHDDDKVAGAILEAMRVCRAEVDAQLASARALAWRSP